MNNIDNALKKFKELDGNYFKKFNEYYPLFLSEEKQGIFGPSELFEMALEAQVLVAILGDTAIRRMNYVGFDLLYPFNNPVDWYNWKEKIKERKVPQSIYFSIGIRISAEINRIEQFLEFDAWDSYSRLSSSDFSVSCDRYIEHFQDPIPTKEVENPFPADEMSKQTNIHIHNMNYNQDVESKAVSSLDKLHKSTGIWSNIANVASKIFGL
jgi:hypothetical protein